MEALNMVIKVASVKVNGIYVPVIKLSDDLGKNTGNTTVRDLVKSQLGLA